MMGEVNGLMVLRLLDDDDVILPDILFEVEYAKLFDRVPLEAIVDTDEDETLTLLKDETGTVEKMILPVDDGRTLGKLVMETL